MEGIPFEAIDLQRRSAARRQYVRRIKRGRLRTYLHPFVRSTHPTSGRFILFSQIRTGSHLVQSLINSHPRVYCDTELFMLRRAVSPRLLLKNAMGARREPVYGFMLKPHSPEDEQHSTTDHWIDWMRDEGFKLVHLRREDVLRQALSFYMANTRQIWMHRKGTAYRIERLRVDVARILKIRRFVESWRDVEAKWVEVLPSISFSYERDLESADRHQSTADVIFAFLGVESVPVEAPIERVLPGHPHEYVANWPEVIAAWKEDSLGSRTSTATTVSDA